MFKNLFKKKDTKSPEVPKVAPAPEKKSGGFFSKIKSKLGSGITSRIGKSAAQGEEILGVEITAHEIRLAQVTSNKANQPMEDINGRFVIIFNGEIYNYKELKKDLTEFDFITNYNVNCAIAQLY